MIWILLVISFLSRLVGLNQSFWLDEAAQLVESIRPFSQQLDIAGDFQPPLFHLLLHFWLKFGTSEIWVRLLPVLLGTITVGFVYLLAKQLSTIRVAVLTSLFMALAPFHIYYSHEVRPYALATLLGVVCTYYLLKKNKILYIFTSALFLYSTYLAPFLLITHGLYVFLFEKKLLKSWIQSGVVIALLFLPWVPSFLEQLNIGSGLTVSLPGWSEAVSTPLYKALPLVFTKFILGRINFENKMLYGAIVSGLFLLSGWLILQGWRKNKQTVQKIGLLFTAPILLSFALSFVLPILAPQRVLFCLPFLYLLLALGIDKVPKLRMGIICLFIVVEVLSLGMYFTQPKFQREQWRQAIEFVEMSAHPMSSAVFVFPDAFAPWQWYSKNLVPAIAAAPELVVTESDLENKRPEFLNSQQIFYFHYLTDLTDPQRKTQKFLKELGYVETQVKDFPGVGFISIYEKAFAYY